MSNNNNNNKEIEDKDNHHHHEKCFITNINEKSYYRRPLPDTCIDFSSVDGQSIFTESLLEGYMKTYFILASQFSTQNEPAYCGLSTLAMTLNSLSVDPKKTWRGVWRWYSEELLDCCTDLSIVKEKGITIDEFLCLANCNGAVTECHYYNESNVDEFRNKVIRSCQSNGSEILIASYNRQGLSQTGTGHFSPIAGYHKQRDLVLILDVARFKYPPHWVKTELLFESMKSIDPDSNKSRGYILLKKSLSASSIFKVTATGEVDWKRMLSSLIHQFYIDERVDNVEQVVGSMLDGIGKILKYFGVYDQVNQDIVHIIKEIHNTKLYRLVSSLENQFEITNNENNNNNNNNNNNKYLIELICIIIFSIPDRMLDQSNDNIPASVKSEFMTIKNEPISLFNDDQDGRSGLVSEIKYLYNIISSLSTYCSNGDKKCGQSTCKGKPNRDHAFSDVL
ncbi:hypothetical protein DFA_10091 [Cavenderia fasciculata]|uniref:glutathione gamma-glutamylcysteinyltransferase n=1 Tax=Cavenderia fasciculata TaxID=261658 RepID=F4Q988_CACFS|nr:uncharacterized protein DFA_10091 [Cavenderia fasciculata]EGG15257.1 hypothetical protein DFA_10091 [Cavenderia fasciculata]|eukprot:XP_004351977.1 hypothetical protein DFA_10091 [Cavenderia fasciculata]